MPKGKRKPVKRAAFKEWKTGKDVKWLKVSDERIGQGVFGSVYMGRIKFKDKKPVRVAVKIYDSSTGSKILVAEYQQAIEKLIEAGVRLPKMGFTEYKGQTVLVCQAFIKTHFSGIERYFPEKFSGPAKQHRSKMQKHYALDFKSGQELFKIAAKTINAGYPFRGDFVELMNGQLVPFDLDSLIHSKPEFDKDPKGVIARSLRDLRTTVNASKEERQKLYQIFLKTLNPKYRKIAEKVLEKHKRGDY